jgi:hypothetical protein
VFGTRRTGSGSSGPIHQTRADLGETIPEAFDFDDPHLWAFFLSGKPRDRATKYTVEHEPGLAEECSASFSANARRPGFTAGLAQG